ncbi:uncharacterized protein LOC105192559 [Harpegnathos saltator]|uniref:Heparanase n=1 Tax=Harpegnathos saltator TaxID=610380 RepID=E2B9G7_HARSA|nr:uncharacterized protein LOC105192559 [Harpegnathos saltator]EFN87650.1 Heparanase [Harpegnathos saltator]
MKHHRQQCIHLLLQVILLTANCLAENLTLHINFKRPIFVTSGAFLSLTLDPATLLNTTGVLIENFDKYTNMVRGLVPAYVRLGGPGSNSYIYDRVNVHPNDVLFETHSTLIHRWAEDAGLDVIACISPHYIASKSATHSWESTSLAQLLSFNDRMGHNASWQLGYECQTRCDLSADDLGRYVAKLRETLKSYPRYSDSLITGPDIVAYRTAQQREYLRDYLSSAADTLSAITWHPDFAEVTVHGDGISVHPDNIAAEKDELYKVIGHVAANKPLWIAESKPEECKHKYVGALTWTRRLGNVAKLGVQVVMRQFLQFSSVTPDYWVSLLHKTLVGREVLKMEVQSDNESYVHFYSQCTKPSALYERGALTIFGVNLTPREVTASLKGFKIRTFHEYILSPGPAAGNKMFAEKVLLNGNPLDLTDDMKLPDLNPEIVTDPDGLKLQLASGNIGFWVIPNAKVKACTHEEESTTEGMKTKKLSKRHVARRVDGEEEEEEEEEEEDTSPSNSANRKLHAKQERTKRRNDRTTLHILKTKLYRRLKRLLQKNMLQKENGETSNLQKPFTRILEEELINPLKDVQNQQNMDDEHLEGTEKSDEKAEINDSQIAPLKKYKRILLKRKPRAEAEYSLEPEAQDIDKAMMLISRIKSLFQLEKDATSNDVKYETINEEDTTIGTSGEFNEKFGEPAKTLRLNAIEGYVNILHDLLELDKLTTESVEECQISVHEDSTNKGRHGRDLSKRSEDLKKDLLARHSRMGDLKDQIKRKMRRRNDDRKETSLVAPDLTNFDHRRSTYHDLFRQYPSRRFVRSNGHPQHEKATRDVDRMSTEIAPRKNTILRKRPRIDDTKDHVSERKSKRKDVSKREGLLSPLNPRITDSGENGFNSFLRRDAIRGFPEGDVFVTTGDSAEQSGQDYDYVQDDEDDEDSKDRQEKQNSTVEYAKDVFWNRLKIDDDQSDYTPNEFFENVHLPSAKIREGAKDYDDLCEAEFALDKRENNKDNDYNSSTAARITVQPLNEKETVDSQETKTIEKRSFQQLINYHDNPEKGEYNPDTNYEAPGSHLELSAPLRRLTETPTIKYDFTNYPTSDARSEIAKQKLQPELEFSSFFYQPALVSLTRYDYGNSQASSVRPDVDHMENPINDVVLYSRRSKRNDWKKSQGLFAEEMIKEDAANARDCRCRVIRALKSPKKLSNRRIKRDETHVTEFTTQSETANEDANAKPNPLRLARTVPSPTTKNEFDRIMTGEVLPITSVTEADPDYDKREIMTIDSNKSHEAMRTMDVASTPTTSASGTSGEHSARQVMDEQLFFRAQSSTAPSEVEKATYDSAEAALQVSSQNTESRQELVASGTEEAQQASTSLCEETQDLQKKIQQESIDAATEGGKAKRRRSDDSEVNSKSDEETPKQKVRKTPDYSRSSSRSNKLKRKKGPKETRQNENDLVRLSKKCAVRANERSNRRRITQSTVPLLLNSEFKNLARYEEFLTRLNERREKLRERQEKHRQNPAKISDEQTRNLSKREAWEKFCENDDFCQLIQEKLFLISNDDSHVDSHDDDYDDDVNDDDVNNDDDDGKEDGHLPMKFTPERYDALQDQTYSRANMKHEHYPEYKLHYYFLRHPKVVEIEQEPTTRPTSSGRKIFAIDPSTYRGGEPVLELHDEYLDSPPKHSSRIEFQTQTPNWTLKDFYQTSSRPMKVYGDQQMSNDHDNYHGRECAKKSQSRDAFERGNAVVLYILDKHRQYDLRKELAELSRIYLNTLDRRDVDQIVRDQTASDSNNGDSKSTLTTARKVGLARKIDEKSAGTNRYIRREKLDNRSDKTVEKEANKSNEMNDKVEDSANTGASNVEVRSVEEEIVDNGDSKESGLLDTSDTTLRSRRNAEEETSDKFRQPTRASTADVTIGDDRYICMKERDSEEVSSEQSIPLYQLTRLPSDAVLFRKPKNYVTSSSGNFGRQGEEQSSKYVVLMPDKIENTYPYEMLQAKNPERSLRVSNWLDSYLPRITDAMIRYLNDVSSGELDYEDSSEEISDEEVSYSLDYSNESNENRQNVFRNIADEVERESGEDDQHRRAKSKESHRRSTMKDQMRSEQRRVFKSFPKENEKMKRQRRQAEINKINFLSPWSETNKSILTDDTAKDENDKDYLQRSSINEEVIVKVDYPHSQKNRKNHDDLPENIAKSEKNDITFAENRGNDESLENSITQSDKKLVSFVEKTIPKLQGVILDGVENAKDLTESVEKLVSNFKESFNETLMEDEETSSINKTSESIDNAFHFAIMNIKKFFTLFTGIS